MSPFRLNGITGLLDLVNATTVQYFKGVLASAPSSPIEGWTYINSVTNGYYIYYSGSWQLIATLTPAALEFLLLETNDILLLETGFKLAKE
jgi:hypothetical protein